MQGPSPQQEKWMWTALSALGIALLVALAAAVAWLLILLAGKLQAVIIPVAIAGILAYLLDPIVRFFQVKLKLGRTPAVLLLIGTLALVFIGFLLYLVPLVIEQASTFINNFPSLLDQIRAAGTEFLINYPALDSQLGNIQAKLTDNWTTYVGEAAKVIWAGAGSVFSTVGFILGLVILPLYIFYFLRDKEAIEQHWQEYVPIHRSWVRDEALIIVQEINKHMIAFFRGQLVVALILGILTGIGLSIIGLRYAVLIGVITATFSIIPYLGVVLSITPALLIAYVQSGGSWLYVLLTAGVFALVQMAEGMFVSPKVMGDQTGLHPVTIIICILVWSILLGGLMGAILAVPLTATLKVLMYRYVWQPAAPPA